ncbi:MAG: hypothetical protein OHK0017_07890 [Patescibacteria group bacterium]
MSFNLNKIVLSAGHGAGDPGAVNGQHREADQCMYMVDRMAEMIRRAGIECDVVPHNQGLQGAINWVNARYKMGDAWVIEIHRDSTANAASISQDRLLKQCGVYFFGGSAESQRIGETVAKHLTAGGSVNTWSRPDTAARPGMLGWIRNTRPMAHLLELGFMQGDNSQNHLNWLADISAQALIKTLGRSAVSQSAVNSDIHWVNQDLSILYLGARANNDWDYIIGTIIDRDAEIAELAGTPPRQALLHGANMMKRYTEVRNANDWDTILNYLNGRDAEIKNLRS